MKLLRDNKEPVAKEMANQHILNLISPTGIDYTDVSVSVSESTGKIYTIFRYPIDGVNYGWLAPLCNLEGTITVIEYRYTESYNVIQVYNRRLAELKGDRDLKKQESERQQIDKSIKDLEDMIHRMAILHEPIGYVNIMLLIQDLSSKELKERQKRVSGQVAIQGCSLRILQYKQLMALQSVSPYGIPNEKVAAIGERNMPISTFIGGFPMASTGIHDDDGFYIGKTDTGHMILINIWKRNKDRVNSNWWIQGMPGLGKSTFVKLLFVKEYAYGTRILINDPEQEYHSIANHPDINGEIIDCAGGLTGRINPLQIRKSPRVTQEDLAPGENLSDYFEYDEVQGISDMALYIQSLRVFFRSYFGSDNFTPGIKAELERCLIETYNKFDITWDTDITKLLPEQFPIFSDLYKVAMERREKAESEYKKNICDQLIDLLYPLAEGADQFMWNGPTTLSPKSDFIVLDTSGLIDMDSNVKNAQFHNINTWAWGFSAEDRSQRVLYDVDEGYLFVDPDYPETMKFLRNYSKRDRKYEAGLAFVTHSVVDVLDEKVKRMGQALIDNACYKFLMGGDGKNLEETKKLFKLTEKEENILSSRNRGQGILCAGGVRVNARIDVRENFLKMFGAAGGR